jgi:hypothetical protein
VNRPGRGEDDPRTTRPTIEERAARRDRIDASPGDRWNHLVRALRAGREIPLETETRVHVGWNPILWRLLAAIAVGIVLYGVLRVGSDWLRQQRVDTWSGPAATVQSGQQLAGCAAVDGVHDEIYPSWLRVGSTVYVLTDAIRPVPASEVGRTTYTESGYTLGAMRLLYDEDTAQGMQRAYVLVYSPPAIAARVYQAAAGCR